MVKRVGPPGWGPFWAQPHLKGVSGQLCARLGLAAVHLDLVHLVLRPGLATCSTRNAEMPCSLAPALPLPPALSPLT